MLDTVLCDSWYGFTAAVVKMKGNTGLLLGCVEKLIPRQAADKTADGWETIGKLPTSGSGRQRTLPACILCRNKNQYVLLGFNSLLLEAEYS